MSNDFFNHTNRFVKLDTVRAGDVNGVFDQVEAGFDDVEVKTNAAIKLPDGESATVLSASGSRANKVLSFDASGNPETSINASAVQEAEDNAHTVISLYDDFQKRYLGPKAEDPTTDNEGNPLFVGALYLNTATNEMKFWSSTAWQTAYSPFQTATQEEMEAGTETALRSMSPALVNYAISSSSVLRVSYDNRGSLRSLERPPFALVDGLGLFVYSAGSTELDDDETCFATANGRWLLQAISYDFAFEYLTAMIDAAKPIRATVANTLAVLASVNLGSFSVSVPGANIGATVFVSPNAAVENPATSGRHGAIYGIVTAPSTVTIYIANPSAGQITFATGLTFTVLVFNP